MTGTQDAIAMLEKLYRDVEAIAQSKGLSTAVVASIPATGVVSLTYPGATTATAYPVARCLGFAPQIGDVVLVAPVPGGVPVVVASVMQGVESFLLDGPLAVNPTTGTTTLALANAASNTGIEIGTPASAETPYIDFHSGGNSTDYDARLIASGGTGTNGQGTLTYQAGTHAFAGAISMPANALTSLNIDTCYLLLTGFTGQSSTNATNATSSRVAALQVNVTLPTGSWNILLYGGGVVWNDTDPSGNVGLWLTNNTVIATAQAGTFPYTWTTGADAFTASAVGTFGGLTGSQSFFVAFANNGTGTAHLTNPFLLVFGKRTS